jgi:hypothetical protein
MTGFSRPDRFDRLFRITCLIALPKLVGAGAPDPLRGGQRTVRNER